MSPAQAVIVDLSSNNANPADIDWQTAAANGLVAVFGKATQGTGYTNPYYEDYLACRSFGLAFAAYHYLTSGTPAAEAAHFRAVAQLDAKIVDVETLRTAPRINTFLAALNEPADEEMTYGSAGTLPSGITRGLLWPASWGKPPGYGACWQFTDAGTVPGIPGTVDLSVWTGTPEQFNVFFGLSPMPTPSAYGIVKPLTGRYGVLNTPAVAIAQMPKGDGYTLVSSDGGTFNYGSAPMLGSLAGKPLAGKIVDAKHTSTGQGLVLLGTDGGVFCFGDAAFEGAVPPTPLNAPAVSIELTPTDKGYWIVAADGGVFAYGDAPFFGSMGGRIGAVDPG